MKTLGWAENPGAHSRQNKKSPATQRGTRVEIPFNNGSWSWKSSRRPLSLSAVAAAATVVHSIHNHALEGRLRNQAQEGLIPQVLP